MKELVSAGGVVFTDKGGDIRLLMILDRFGYWTLPKGKVEAGETAEEAALREIREETGISGRILKCLGETDYVYVDEDEESVHKKVIYYLVEANGFEVTPAETEIAGAEWVSLEEAQRRCAYRNNLEFVRMAIAALRPTPL